jgi:hypothetical protein
VKATTYSSLTAFLAHLRALRATAAASPEQSGRRQAMEALVAELSPAERESLEAADTGGESGRHRERAERHLTRILRERGVLTG